MRFRNAFLNALVVFEALIGGTAMADHLADLRDWHRLGLPAAANWNVTGMQTWHVAQVKAGHRVIPTVPLPAYQPLGTAGVNSTNPRSLAMLDAIDFAFLRENNLPFCLCTGDICNSLNDDRYRPPTVPRLADSPVVWRRLADGSLDATRIVDPFGPLTNWRAEGKLWGTSPYVKRVRELYPSPPLVLFVESSGGPYDDPKRYTREGSGGAWLPISQVEALSLRMRDWIADHGGTPSDFYPTFHALRAAQREVFHAAFASGLPEWREKIVAGGYGTATPAAIGPSETDRFEAGSPQHHVKGVARSDFTSLLHADIFDHIPGWRRQRAANDKSWREVSTFIDFDGAVGGLRSGTHEAIGPDRWQGYAAFLLWSMQEPGVPVMLRHWTSPSTRANDPFVPPMRHGDSNVLGLAGWEHLVVDSYQQAELAAIDRICDDPEVRRFWLDGRPVSIAGGTSLPRLLDVDINTPRAKWMKTSGAVDSAASIKVWCLAFELPDGNAMIYAWTPCKLPLVATVSVPERGDFALELNDPRGGYWALEAPPPATWILRRIP
jgi:hypothetical protein